MMTKCLDKTVAAFSYIHCWMNAGYSLAALLSRVFISKYFFLSGRAKWLNMDSTIFLFKHEYSVPLLSPEFAAYAATFAELTLPVLFLMGLGTRWVALALFLVNGVVVYSYPWLQTPEGAAALTEHYYIGLITLLLITAGGGRLSVDALIKRCVNSCAAR